MVSPNYSRYLTNEIHAGLLECSGTKVTKLENQDMALGHISFLFKPKGGIGR